MRNLTAFLFFAMFPLVAFTQPESDLFAQLTLAINNEKWDESVSLFRKAIDADTSKAEMFYWTKVNKKSPVCPRLAHELAIYYQQVRNYDKAYLFYKELIQMQPDNVSNLVSCANMELLRGKEKEALSLYQRILDFEPDNLAANIFVGNYYYLSAEEEKAKVDADFKKIGSPTRMQYARYRNALDRILNDNYSKAKRYLQNVLQHFPSSEVQKTLAKIQLIEKEVNR